MADLRVRRLLVALDASQSSRQVLHLAGELAAALQAELAGVFIEDEELANAATLPFSRVIQTYNANTGVLDSRTLQRQMKIVSEQARVALETSASFWRVKHSFRVVRGKVGAVLLETARETDLVGIGSRNWRIGGSMRLGDCACEVVKQAGKSVLLLPSNPQRGQNLLVILEADSDLTKILDPVIRLCRISGAQPIIAIAALRQDHPALQEAVADHLALHGIAPAIIRLLSHPGIPVLKQLTRQYRVRLLVIGSATLAEDGKALQLLIQAVDTATLLVS